MSRSICVEENSDNRFFCLLPHRHFPESLFSAHSVDPLRKSFIKTFQGKSAGRSSFGSLVHLPFLSGADSSVDLRCETKQVCPPGTSSFSYLLPRQFIEPSYRRADKRNINKKILTLSMMVGETKNESFKTQTSIFSQTETRANDEQSNNGSRWNNPSRRSRNTNRTRRYQRCQSNRYSRNDCNLHTSLYGSRRTNTSNKAIQLGRPQQQRNRRPIHLGQRQTHNDMRATI